MSESKFDLNWPEVALAVFVIIIAVAAIAPDVLWVAVDAIKALAGPLGDAMGKLNPFKD
jgi:hypothetical protein